MSLISGQTLSFYEVLGPLGAGGMGEVYRARDTRLDREVAIKVLPEAMASDEERLRRFEREAKTLASLNHPNVAGIHGVDQVDELWFLALELVPGEDLATRIARGPLPVDEAIDVCRQIAEGLEAAHEAGVVHRDLKPANVRVTPDGTVKLLDFGLAKPIQPKVTGEGTSTTESDSFLMTEEGVVLGTPTYMSPEQARGKPVDRRTDLWAFGCVLYECLTGKRAFGAASFTDVLARIVSDEPDWSALPPLPPRVEELLRRALIKDPRARLRDAGEARVQLQLAQSEPARAVGAAESETGAPETSAARGRGPALALTGALCLVGGLALGALLRSDPPAEVESITPVAAPAIPAPDLHVVLETLPPRVLGNDLALSPDGTRVAWVAMGNLHVRRLDELTSTVLIETDPNGTDWEEVPAGIAWSPDGRELAFVTEGGIYRLPSTGGAVIPVVESGEYQPGPRRLCWTEDLGLLHLSADGAALLSSSSRTAETVELVTAEEVGVDHLDGLAPMPGGGVLLVTHLDGVASPDTLHLWRSGELREVLRLPGWKFERVAVTGEHLVLERAVEGKRSLWTIGFEPQAGTIDGEPVLHVDRGMYPTTDRGGSILYARELGVTRHQPVWVDADGQTESFGRRIAAEFLLARLSHDERTVFLSTPQSKAPVLAYDIERGLATAALPEQTQGAFVAGSLPDGRLLLASWVENTTVAHDTSGAREPEEICSGILFEVDRAGERGLVMPAEGSGTGDQVIGLLDLATGEVRDLPHASSVGAGGPSFSPDGRYMLYTSKGPGRHEVFLAEAELGGRRWQVTTEGAYMGLFDAAGEWLYCLSGGLPLGTPLEVWRVSVEYEPDVRLGVPELLFSAEEEEELMIYDYHTGQQRFVGVRTQGEGDHQIVLDTSLRRAE